MHVCTAGDQDFKSLGLGKHADACAKFSKVCSCPATALTALGTVEAEAGAFHQRLMSLIFLNIFYLHPKRPPQ